MERQDWMAVLARAPKKALAESYRALGDEPPSEWLRPPEFGSVMVRGRMGGTGAPFNLGERGLRLADGTVGHAYVPGRDAEKARIAAVCDALLQGPASEAVRDRVVRPMQALLARVRADREAKAAATKVEFFTVARGED